MEKLRLVEVTLKVLDGWGNIHGKTDDNDSEGSNDSEDRDRRPPENAGDRESINSLNDSREGHKVSNNLVNNNYDAGISKQKSKKLMKKLDDRIKVCIRR